MTINNHASLHIIYNLQINCILLDYRLYITDLQNIYSLQINKKENSFVFIRVLFLH